ncbi:MAG: hypothetical protein ACK4TA_01650 [Saprospiraceae bacterium]
MLKVTGYCTALLPTTTSRPWAWTGGGGACPPIFRSFGLPFGFAG